MNMRFNMRFISSRRLDLPQLVTGVFLVLSLSTITTPTLRPIPVAAATPLEQVTGEQAVRVAETMTVRTQIPSSSPTIINTSSPTTVSPTASPTTSPTASPTKSPTIRPTKESLSTNNPSIDITQEPSENLSFSPTASPSVVTPKPSLKRTQNPSLHISSQPSSQPIDPSTNPSTNPSLQHSSQPSQSPSVAISSQPSLTESSKPSLVPSNSPSNHPSQIPSQYPTETLESSIPSVVPTDSISLRPTDTKSSTPSAVPTVIESISPTVTESSTPSAVPTVVKSMSPTDTESSTPSAVPTVAESISPTVTESSTPSAVPTIVKSISPTDTESSTPSAVPTILKSLSPTDTESSIPTVTESSTPSAVPTVLKSSNPTVTESLIPSSAPTIAKTLSPTDTKSLMPSSVPTVARVLSPSVTKISNPTSWCVDTTEDFSIPRKKSGQDKNRNCAWVSQNTQLRCKQIINDGTPVKYQCPITCDQCTCRDNPNPFQTNSGETTCALVRENTRKCQMLPSARENCPATCSDECKVTTAPTKLELTSEQPTSSPVKTTVSPTTRSTSSPTRLASCRDNPNSFDTNSGQKTCAWVKKNLQKCQMLPTAKENCPATCGICVATAAPTQSQLPPEQPAPSPIKTTVSPTTRNISSPTAFSWCQDNTRHFFVKISRDKKEARTCSWVGDNRKNRCPLEGVKNQCPVTCNFCHCKNNPQAFISENSETISCASVQGNPSECTQSSPVLLNCPLACNQCITTVGSMPSSSPSAAKSDIPSSVESSSPTNSLSPTSSWSIINYETEVSLGFAGFSSKIEPKAQAKFKDITKNFLMETKKDEEDVDVIINSITITKQFTVRGTRDGIRDQRRLQESDNIGLVVRMVVEGETKSRSISPLTFAFADTVLDGVKNDFSGYKSKLEQDPVVFNAVMGLDMDGEEVYETTPSNHTLYIFIGSAVAGSVLIAFLAIMFVKLRNDRHRLQKLPANLTFQDENEFIQSQGSSVPFGSAVLGRSGMLNSFYDEHTKRSLDSRSTMNGSRSNPESLGVLQVKSHGNSHESKSSSKRSKNSGRQLVSRSSNDAWPLDASGQFQGKFSEWGTPSDEQQSSQPSNDRSCSTGDNRGANSSLYASHDAHSHVNANMVSSTRSDSDSESLGLNLSPDALFEAQRQKQQFTFVPQECDSISGLFPNNFRDLNGNGVGMSYPQLNEDGMDCITFEHNCPPGPLGLIIDTTTSGPMIHSVKPTSVLLDILMPGDILIALDDRNTRMMTAPLITSLMASKSQQRHRKLTILRHE